MIYGNRFLNEGFLDKFKKKKKEIKKQEPKKTKRIEFTSEEKDLIENTLKEIVKEYNSDLNNKKKIENKIKERIKKGDYDSDVKFTKFICELFEDLDDEISFTVCDDSQEARIEAYDVYYDMGKELQNRLNKKGLKVTVSSGDGDEGCLYISNNKTQ